MYTINLSAYEKLRVTYHSLKQIYLIFMNDCWYSILYHMYFIDTSSFIFPELIILICFMFLRHILYKFEYISLFLCIIFVVYVHKKSLKIDYLTLPFKLHILLPTAFGVHMKTLKSTNHSLRYLFILDQRAVFSKQTCS